MSSIKNEPYDLGAAAQNLYQMIGDIAGITVEVQGNLLAMGVRNESATATIFLQGAQLSHYKQRDKPSVIWLSETSEHQQGKPLRGGIPLCWPWFGDLNKNPEPVKEQLSINNAPTHGFARNQLWNLDRIEVINHEETLVALRLDVDKLSFNGWSFPATLLMTFTIGKQLSIDFSVENTGEESFSYSTALHSYFPVNNIHEAKVFGLENCNYHDCLDDWAIKTQADVITFTEETDRLYYFEPREGSKDMIIKDQNHSINISSTYSHSCVVWNPWIEKSKTLSGFANDDYLTMLCVETARAGKDFVTLAPGESQVLKLVIESIGLNA